MRKIVVWFEQGGGLQVQNNSTFVIKTAKKINYLEWLTCIYTDVELSVGSNTRVYALICTANGIIVRMSAAISSSSRALISITIWGDFEPDQLSITSEGTSIPYTGRLEIRNEYGVLIADNGVAWVNGIYPPDAKNRSGLTGLHAAVINKELDDALTGDVTNKESELNEMERGDGVQHALEKDEDNGL